jgi:hypothetical protein
MLALLTAMVGFGAASPPNLSARGNRIGLVNDIDYAVNKTAFIEDIV